MAEAEGIDKKAEAMRKYGEAAIIEMIMQAMPEIAKNVAEPLSKVDKITMYGEGNSAKLIQDIVNGTTQVTEGMTQGLGLDLKALVSGFLGGKAAGKDGNPGGSLPFRHRQSWRSARKSPDPSHTGAVRNRHW